MTRVILVKINTLMVFIVLLFYILADMQSVVFAESYNDFLKTVEHNFEGSRNKNNKKVIIGRFEDGSDFDFVGTLYANYENFAEDRYKHGDFIDAYYFKTKAEKIKRYKIISPANPYSFGILPDDIEQFIVARDKLRNVSINSIVNSSDGLVLADSYIAYDCWLEAFEEGNSIDRLNRCKGRFLDNMKAIRISLSMQGYSIFDIVSKNDSDINDRSSVCESCALYKKGQYCNTLYFNSGENRMMDKMNIVIKRLEQKLSYFNSPEILIMYYNNTSKTSDLLDRRLDAAKNLLYNVISRDLPIKPTMKIMPVKLDAKSAKNELYKNAITVCVSGNE